MGCYRLEALGGQQNGPSAVQTFQVTGLKRDINALHNFLESGRVESPYTVLEFSYAKEAASTLMLQAPTHYQGSPLTMEMIATHLNVVGEELRLEANLRSQPRD